MSISEIMWSIPRRKNTYKHGWRVSLSTRLFTDSPEGPGKEQSLVTCLLVYRSPFLSIENFSATPSGTTLAFSI